MSKTLRTRWYLVYDAEPAIGIIRCPAGNVAEFNRLAHDLLAHLGEDSPDVHPIGAPIWRWYRHNPCAPGGEYGWLLGHAGGPGPGNWTGAFVVRSEDADRLERIEMLSGYEAVSDVA